MIVVSRSGVPPSSGPNSAAASRAWKPAARGTPTARPTAVAKMPTPIASTAIDRVIWRPVAPKARSRPISWMRWPTMIEKTL